MSKIYHLRGVNHKEIADPVTTFQDKDTALNWFQNNLNKTLSFSPFEEGDEPAYKLFENDLYVSPQWTKPIDVYEK